MARFWQRLPFHSNSSSRRKRRFRSLVAGIEHLEVRQLLAADLGTTNADDAVDQTGFVAGSFDVNSSGAATYNVPLQVSPGTAGMQPTLSLAYSSLSGNGIVGRGWQLAGVSSISRSSATLAQDGFKDGVDFDSSDRFKLDGQRLVLVSGQYGTSGSEYRTESDSFRKVVAYGQQGHGPQRFKVWTKDGRILEYGHTGDSRVEASNNPSVVKWALNKVTDRKGNYLTIKYVENRAIGQHYPHRIDYTGNEAAGLVPYASVRFRYEGRTDDTNGFLAGAKVSNRVRLAEVSTWHGNDLLREYRLEYEESGPTDTSLLKTITECAADGTCLAPTTFEWESSQDTGKFQIKAFHLPHGTPSVSDEENTLAADFNGDGQTDLIQFANGRSFVWTANDDGNSFDVSEFIPSAGYRVGEAKDYKLGDFNADGKADLLKVTDHIFSTWFSNGNGSFRVVETREQDRYGDGRQIQTGDFNGDGRTDLIFFDKTETQIGISAGGGRFMWHRFVPWSGYDVGKGERFDAADFNGDGRTDLIHFYGNFTNVWLASANGTFDVRHFRPANSYPDVDNGHRFRVANINNDGNADLINFLGNRIDVWVGKGNGLFEIRQHRLPSGVNLGTGSHTKLGDFNGDGLTDIVAFRNNKADVYLNTSQFSFEKQAIGLWAGYATGDESRYEVGDWNGDGRGDLLHLMGRYTHPWMSRLEAPERVSQIINGIGHTITVDYQSLSQSVDGHSIYAKGTKSRYPTIDFQGPLYVVAQHSESNGVGSLNAVEYSYAGAKYDLRGRGFRRFDTQFITDVESGRSTELRFHRDSRGAAIAPKRVIERLNDGTIVSEVRRIFSERQSHAGVYQTFARFTRTIANDLDGKEITSSFASQYQDIYGNILSSEVDYGDGLIERSTYHYHAYDTEAWIIGSLGHAKTTRHAPGHETRTSIEAYHYDDDGYLIRHFVEPGNLELGLTTKFWHDAFGNVVHVSNIGFDGDRRVARRQFHEYDDRGRFVTKSKNGVGHSQQFIVDQVSGLVEEQVDPNGNIYRIEYDGFGRPVTEFFPDGTETTYRRRACTGNCPANAVLFVTARTTGQAPVTNYLDVLGRTVRYRTLGFDGTPVISEQRFDSRGRLTSSSSPHFVNESANWTHFAYDDMNRVIKETAPGNRESKVIYDGRTVTSINPLGQHQVQTIDALGRIVSVTDNLGGTVTFTFNAASQLVETKDATGNVIYMTYDVRGNRTSLDDPDLGLTTYVHNAFGEVIEQIDAKGQTQRNTFDSLGRLTQRVEPEGVSSWFYDDSSFGELIRVIGPNGYEETATYDDLGRIVSTSVRPESGDAFYTVQTSYDSAARVIDTTYPSGFKTNNTYNDLGYLSEVRNASDNSLIWKAENVNALGQYEEQLLGNGLRTQKRFDQETGRLLDVSTGDIQHLTFTYDTIGNLTRRADALNSVQESFTYDGLNRLTSSSISYTNQYGPFPATTFEYDAGGSITYKSDVGWYLYGGAGASQPHAVTSIVDSNGIQVQQFVYDANGNRVESSDGSVTYSSFDKPITITKGDTELSFLYGPDRNRVKQTVSTNNGVESTKIYVQGIYEIEVQDGSVTETHFVSGGDGLVAIHTISDAGTASTNFVHTDHLGSIQSVTDENGVLLETHNYDAWGARRDGTTWQPTGGTFTGSTDRGFTVTER